MLLDQLRCHRGTTSSLARKVIFATMICFILKSANAFNARTDRLVPKFGTYFGVAPDWGAHNFQTNAIVQDLGIEPVTYVVFTKFPLDNDAIWGINTTLTQIALRKAAAIITPEPLAGLESVTDASVTAYVKVLRKYEDMGATIIVRFAHEMNGSWYPWGQKPAAFKAAFRRFAKILHANTKYATMLWAPNVGPGYPYRGGAHAFDCTARLADCDDADTNKDGVVNGADDMFKPYWPGADAVDWVGTSLYWWGDQYPWGENEIATPTNFGDVLLGKIRTVVDDPIDTSTVPIPSIYAEYSVAYNKPLIIAETSGLYNLCDKNVNTVGCNATTVQPSNLQLKKSWFDQVYRLKGLNNIPVTFPNIKIISWFDFVKVENEAQGNTVDWSISKDKTVKSAFKLHLSKKFFKNGAFRRYWLTAADFRKSVWSPQKAAI